MRKAGKTSVEYLAFRLDCKWIAATSKMMIAGGFQPRRRSRGTFRVEDPIKRDSVRPAARTKKRATRN